jgi:hypothetical protein
MAGDEDSLLEVEGSARKHGEVVWGKCPHHPWWPAQVIAIQHHEVPEAGLGALHDQWQGEVQRVLNENENENGGGGESSSRDWGWPYIVRFYGEKGVSWDFLTDEATRPWDDPDMKTAGKAQRDKYESANEKATLKKFVRAIKEADSVFHAHEREGVKKKGFDILDYPLSGGKVGRTKLKKDKKKKKKKITKALAEIDRRKSQKLARELQLFRVVATDPSFEEGNKGKATADERCEMAQRVMKTSHLWHLYNRKIRSNIYSVAPVKGKEEGGGGVVAAPHGVRNASTVAAARIIEEEEEEEEDPSEFDLTFHDDRPTAKGKRPQDKAEEKEKEKGEPRPKKRKTLVERMKQPSTKYLYENEQIDFNLGLVPDADTAAAEEGDKGTNMDLDLDANVNSQAAAAAPLRDPSPKPKPVVSPNTVVIRVCEGSGSEQLPSEDSLRTFGKNFGSLMRMERRLSQDECKLVFFEPESASKCAKNAIQFGLCGLAYDSITVQMHEEGFLPSTANAKAAAGGGGGGGGLKPATATYKPSEVPKVRPVIRERPNMLANHNSSHHSNQLDQSQRVAAAEEEDILLP